MSVCLCVYIYLCVCVCVCLCVCVCVSVCACAHACLLVCICVFLCVWKCQLLTRHRKRDHNTAFYELQLFSSLIILTLIMSSPGQGALWCLKTHSLLYRVWVGRATNVSFHLHPWINKSVLCICYRFIKTFSSPFQSPLALRGRRVWVFEGNGHENIQNWL